ncbi:hypothetical protein [Bacillus thuringiensis]|uniref:hypothetical protein n=1 Tax=Bacillus thuringiensis TaxID=1428 RepID=UPI000BFE4012|nr:hypothetical protein [Bacillus thuringiensis]PGM15572.1 hypothetical protein CN938_11140 [Bacillus thuringiensis]
MYWVTQAFPGYKNFVCPYNLIYHFVQDSDFRIDLTGTWKCDDGGLYYIRQVPMGTDVMIFWAGLSQQGVGDYFSNVFIGILQRTGIIDHGRWVDVPYGNARSFGDMTLRVEDNGKKLRAIEKTGGFGGSVWTRL